MTRTLVTAMLLVLCLATAAGSAAEKQQAAAAQAPVKTAVFTGVWEGRCLFSKVEAHVQQDGDKIKGVALVHTITGDVNPYHFKGTIQDGRIEASHFRGHSFLGEIVSADEVAGVLTTAKKGHKLKLRAKRVGDTPLKK